MTTQLRRRPKHQQAGGLDAVAWTVDEELGYEDWLRIGRRLGIAGRGAGWWIGDWLRYGTARYGSKYTVAARVTGYDPQTLMNMVYVAAQFPISRRREELSWSHHAELAAFQIADQERWLDRALEERLSVRDLRAELAAVRQSDQDKARNAKGAASAPAHVSTNSRVRCGAASSSPNTRTDRITVCPHCGHRFVEKA